MTEMGFKSEWKEASWITKAQLILMALLFPLLAVIAVDNCQRFFEKTKAVTSTKTTEWGKPQPQPQESKEQ